MGTLTAISESLVRQLEEAAWHECVRRERWDLLVAIREGGYELTERPDRTLEWKAGGEVVLLVRIGLDGQLQRLPN